MGHSRHFHTIAFCLVLLAGGSIAHGQAARVEATAVSGTPFGVASVSFRVPGAADHVDRSFYSLEDPDGRVFYPVFADGPTRRAIAEIFGINQGPTSDVRLFFLFRGQEPLSLRLHTPDPTHVVLAPRAEPRRHSQLLQQWWRAYHSEARAQKREGDYPPLLQDYLTNMLGRRLGLATPILGRLTQSEPAETKQAFDLLLGSERLHDAALVRAIQGRRQVSETMLSPPPAPEWPQAEFAPLDPQPTIEPIARRVPRECFYVRFGSFANFLWLDRLMTEYGGDISRMATLRGHETGFTQRLQKQLALKKTTLSELLGDQVIADMALVGADAFLQDGAAVGVVFQARSNVVLTANMESLRAEALELHRSEGAVLDVVEIAGKKVSRLKTPDNQLRSFYVTEGDYHFVTSSRHLAERFLQVAKDGTSLGDSGEFAHARALLPESNRYTVFFYASQPFLQGLVSPQYQIELARRLDATIDMQLLALARQAAANEGLADASLEQLIRQGFLPEGFGRRPDASGIIMTDRGSLDSLRGRRGYFLPIPDVTIESITTEEASTYDEWATELASNVRQFDPVMAGLKREPAGGRREKVTIDARVSLLDESQYGWLLSVLGPPNQQRVVGDPNDILNVQATLQGGLLSTEIPTHQVFLGLQDATPPADPSSQGVLGIWRLLTTTPGYLGAWPSPGYLDWLPIDLSQSEPSPDGYSRLPLGLWRRQWDEFSALSFQLPVLERVTPRFRIVEDPVAAQVRVRVGDISASQIRSWVNQLYYDRAAKTTAANLRLLLAAQQQLRLPPEKAKPWIEQLLDTRLVCTLGGEYQLQEGNGRAVWQSTARDATGRALGDFEAPVMSWFRGMQGYLTKDERGVRVRAEIEMERKPNVPGLTPLLRTLGGDQGSRPKPSKPPVRRNF